MSYRNFMIVYTNSTNNSLDRLKEDLIEVAKKNSIGIHFNIVGYYNELLEVLNITNNYFCISDDFEHIECENTFSIVEAFDYMISLKLDGKEEKKRAEKNYLIQKLKFLNEFVELIFQTMDNHVSIEFYFSDQYGSTLEDYRNIIVDKRNLTEAFVQMLQPTKKDNYIGVKTTKFIIK